MSLREDWEFSRTTTKEIEPEGPATERATSKLSIASLVLGILGVTLLPLLGSILAIVAGHAATAEIDRARGRLEGRGLARAGLALGYINVVLGTLLAVAGGLYLFRGRPPVWALETKKVETRQLTDEVKSRGADVREASGVRMANQMGRDDFRLIENTGVDARSGEIIACYNGGKPASDPELALLTTRKLSYVKDGRTTEFDLKDVTGLKNDMAFEQAYRQALGGINNQHTEHDPSTYHVEVKSARGTRMHLEIRPERDGAIFFDALQGAALKAGAKLEPAAVL